MVKFKILELIEGAFPVKGSKLASGYDLRNMSGERIVLEPKERILVETGIKILLEPGYEAQIRPRSGLAIKKGITVLNSPGTIDADYRGEIKVILVNAGNQMVSIDPNERIAQMVIAEVLETELVAITEEEFNLNTTERGDGGFGHTGTH